MMACGETGCPEAFVDGFCDVCGKPEISTPGTTATIAVPRVRQVVSSTLPVITRASRSDIETARKVRRTVSSRKADAGLTWPLPSCPALLAPESMVMEEPSLPPGKAVCAECGKPVDPSGRFCDACGAEHAFKPALRPGDLVADQYKVAGCLAHGGMGWIYLAQDVRLERRVVLKGVLNGKDEGAAAAAALEKRHLVSMRHPSIVSIQDFVHHGERTYIVMEYVEGISLKTLKAVSGPLRIHEALGCILHLLPALGALHEAGLAYCDLKPDNVMLLPGGGLKLIDLGAVRSIGETSEDVYGTEGYMPPTDGPDDGIPSVAMDIHAAGRTLAALLLDFDNTGEHRHSLPFLSTVNRMVGIVEAARLTGYEQGSLRFSLLGGEPLPAWIQVTEMEDRKRDKVHVLHGSAPDGFTRLEVAVSRNGSSGTLSLDCPLAFDSLRCLVERATHADPESRFHSASDMAVHCAGVLRELLGAEGLPSPGAVLSFAQADRDIAFFAPVGKEWSMLPPPRLNKGDDAFETVVRVLDDRNDNTRLANLEVAVREGGGSNLWGIDPHLRYVETFFALETEHGFACDDKVRDFLRQAVQINPWDWRPAWMEGKYWMAVGKAAEALACFSYVLRILPGEALPKVAVGSAMELLNNPQDALLLHDAALRISPGFGLARLLRLRCLFLLQDFGFDAALRDFLRAWPTMKEGLVGFIQHQALFVSATDERACRWRLGRLVALNGIPEDEYTLAQLVARMNEHGIANLDMPAGHRSPELSSLSDRLEKKMRSSARAKALNEPRSLVGSLSNTIGGLIKFPSWKMSRQ